MRKFHLQRVEDEGGVSGTGKVAEGVVFSNNWVALTWLTKHTSVAFYMSMNEVKAIHGHGGKTEVVWDDPCCLFCKHPIDDHWGDNCGACMTHLYDDTARACDCVIMGHEERLPKNVKVVTLRR
jgi:hypothetical protein